MVREKIVPTQQKQALEQILEISKEHIQDCIQCAKCSAGCPATSNMDILPHQIIRLLQCGQLEKVAKSQTIWNCASCFTCAARCPREIDLAKLMEAVRLTVIRRSGNSYLKAASVPEKLDGKMPQQAIVSGFRKYSK